MRGFANLRWIVGIAAIFLGVGIAPNYPAKDNPNPSYAVEIIAPASLEPLDACTIIQQWHCTAWEDRATGITFGNNGRQPVQWKRVGSSPRGPGWIIEFETR